MGFIYQSPGGQSLTQKSWEELRYSQEWSFKEYRNDKLWLRLHWVGRYDSKLPPPYRHSFGIEVYNRLEIKESEQSEEGTTVDKGWIIDPCATETFRTRSAAEQAYEDLLLRYTNSSMEVDEKGEIVLAERDNELGKMSDDPTRLLRDEAQVEAAEEKGINLGGWS